MNILLTGANGFIGHYFLDAYQNEYKIKTFSFLNDDLKNLNLNDTNTIVHLSALVHQMDGASKDDYYRVNVENTLVLAKKAKENGVNHFIFMSTVKVYGEESSTVYNECTKCKPQDDYAKSKREAETQLKQLENDTFIISIIRTPIVYGYGVKANIESLVKLVSRVPILPFANINNRRSMVYVSNLCDIIHIIIKRKKSGIFLAGDDYPVSTDKLILLIAEALDKKIMLVSIPYFSFLIQRFKPKIYKRLYQNLEIDNTYTKDTLGFSNQYSPDMGIHLMINKDT